MVGMSLPLGNDGGILSVSACGMVAGFLTRRSRVSEARFSEAVQSSQWLSGRTFVPVPESILASTRLIEMLGARRSDRAYEAFEAERVHKLALGALAALAALERA